MHLELLEQLKTISPEEQRILDGDTSIQKNLYTSNQEFIIDSHKMLTMGKLIDIRPHTRFIHFPQHKHNYIEIIYMCSGSTIHLINNKTSIALQEGDLLFLNQNVTQEIMPASLDDIAVNFIVLPEFFDRILPMMEAENILHDFLIGTLKKKTAMVDHLHFETGDILPITNLVENMIWTLLNRQSNKRNIIQNTMGLLFLQLMNYTDKINQNDPTQFEQHLIFTVLKYIDENYKSGSLEHLAIILNQPAYYLSKLIKKHTGYTYKQLLQNKRLGQATYLLSQTKLPVEDIIEIIGYENTSYFHRIFRKRFHMTPKMYRQQELLHPPVS